MVHNVDKTILGYQLHQEVGWWSKPTFWEPPWFHDVGNRDGFLNITLLAVQQHDASASLKRFHFIHIVNLYWTRSLMTSVLELLTLWFSCRSLLSEPRFGPGASCTLMMLTIIIPDFFLLKWRTYKQIVNSGTIVACFCLIGYFNPYPANVENMVSS